MAIETDVQQENDPEAKAPDYAEKPEVPPARAALVKEWNERVSKRHKEMEETVFKQMRENQELARRGADKDWPDEKYVVPITNRVINQSVARLYAKNPTAVAKRSRKLMYKVWDGRADTLQAAMQSVAAAVMPPMVQPGMPAPPPMPIDPQALAIVQEVQQVVQYEQMLDKLAQSMEILFAYYINEQAYNYKIQIKAAVRRAKVCRVAYCKIGYQRILELSPERMADIEDVTSKISAIECRLKEMQAGEIDDESARLEELRLNLQDLQNEPDLLVREGFVLDFPRATEVVIDEDCVHLKSLAGARWIAFPYDMTPERVKEVYGVDVKQCFKKYEPAGKKTKVVKALVYQVWDKKLQQTFTICDGYPDFLKEPATPDVRLERFWPIFPLVFKEIEHDEHLFPPSDVENMKHIQLDYNRARESLREHRIAARPYWVTGGQLQDEETKKLGNHASFEVIKIQQLAVGGKVSDLIQAGPVASIDPNLYEVEQHFVDFQRAGGFQESQIGGVAGGTATESSIADASRSVSDADDVDDLDEWLTEIAKAAGQLMLMETDKQTVIEIVGPGAVWPDLPETRTEVAKDLLLEIKAGSSGRPNKAAELANLERAAPILLQVPEIDHKKVLAEPYLRLLDIPVEEGIAAGMPSITAINAMVAKTAAGAPGQETGNPQSNPASQGGEGAQNSPNPQANEPGGQPSYQEPIPTAA